MKAIVTIVASLAMTGCGSGSKSVLDVISKRTVVVLASHDVALTDKAIDLQSTDPINISGTMSSICFALKGGVPMQDMNSMDRMFAAAIGGAHISATLVLPSGNKILLLPAAFSWSENGVIFKDGELAACAVPRCGTTLPVGTTISKVEVTSVPDFTVKGIYWESERDPSEPLVPSLATKQSPDSASSSSCSSTQ